MNILMAAVILLPAAAGILQPVLKLKDRKKNLSLVLLTLAAEAVLITVLVVGSGLSDAAYAVSGEEETGVRMTLFRMSDTLEVGLCVDGLSKFFLLLFGWGYLIVAVFACDYLGHSEEGSFPEYVFWCFYLLSLGMASGLSMASGLISMYLFFELTTLSSMPLVMYDRTERSVNAALKYLFYSIAGALMGLAGIFVLSQYADSMTFRSGGILNASASGHTGVLLAAVFIAVVGFGAKAGMYPLHSWLPTAHPAAPAPASALLSALIAKAGVLAIIRMLYYSAGPELIRGTWVQYALIALALLTVLMGSVNACGESVLKRRLAWSSVSQISYALFGIFLLTPEGLTGGLMQVLFHAMAKCCLFLCAGSVICRTGITDVRDMTGLAKKMPLTFVSFTMASLSLIGIPPFGGFISKWDLAEAALDSGTGICTWLGPVILIISALLTAYYLLPVSIHAFFPGRSFVPDEKIETAEEGSVFLWAPLLILASLTLLLGMFPGAAETAFGMIAESLF